jgi:MauM/NapG family ferredoxin protein
LKVTLWRTLRRISQILFFSIFIIGLLFANRSIWFIEINKSFYRLDFLATLAASIAGRIIITGGILALITILFTFIFGRVWCGWFCPFGTLLDWISPKKKSSGNGRLEKWRVGKYILFFVILFAALLGNQTLLFLDPLTILSRTLSSAIFPALKYAVFQTEGFLYQFRSLWGLLDAVHRHVVNPLISSSEAVSIRAVPIFLFFLFLISLNWIVERFWCRYLCPLGGILGLLSKFSLIRRKVNANCSACSRCGVYCPTGTIRAQENFRSDPAECILCYECAVDCPKNATTFTPVIPWKPANKEDYDPGRRELLLSIGFATFGTVLAGVDSFRIAKQAYLIRPPGVIEERFESLCIRCGECIRVCPTNGLQPTLVEAGWHNIMTPNLVPRLGACNYNCNACGLACPTGAVPALNLDEKQLQVIGLACVDRDRCLPWAYQTPCIICEEACPLPEKAIELIEEEQTGMNGELVRLQKPQVRKEICIGCGICEHQCPQGGEAAIRVYSIS